MFYNLIKINPKLINIFFLQVGKFLLNLIFGTLFKAHKLLILYKVKNKNKSELNRGDAVAIVESTSSLLIEQLSKLNQKTIKFDFKIIIYLVKKYFLDAEL